MRSDLLTELNLFDPRYIPHFLEEVLGTLAEAKESVRLAGVAVLMRWYSEVSVLR